MKKLAPYLAAVLNATIVGLSFLFTKVAIEETTVEETLAYRFIIAWVVLSIFMKIMQKKDSIVKKQSKKGNILALVLLAIFYPTLFFSFQAFGLNYTSSAEGGIVMAFSPAVTALLAAFFLKERVNLTQFAFILISISGVIYIFYMSGESVNFSRNQIIGFIFLLVSAISISGYTVIARFLSVSYSPIKLTFIMVTFGMVYFNLYVIVKKAIQGNLLSYFKLLTNMEFIGAVIFLGVFATMLTSFLSNYILTKITASKMSIFSNLSTVISIFSGAIFLQEEIKYYHLLGSAMIIIGVLGTNFYKSKHKTSQNKFVLGQSVISKD